MAKPKQKAEGLVLGRPVVVPLRFGRPRMCSCGQHAVVELEVIEDLVVAQVLN